MEDRIDTLDVSVTSGDHAVAVEPFIAERIEVLKGSSTLLYGSGAIGGVVDVHTGRIPHELSEHALSGGVETRYDNNNHGNTTAIKLNGGFGQWAWHVDGAAKDADDYDIPGFAVSSRRRSLDATNGADAVRGSLPGSAFDSKSAAVGASYIDDWGFAGVAVSQVDADYGLPGSAEVSASGSTPTLQLEQTRSDFELGVADPFNGFTSLNVRVGRNDYEHEEIEPDGEVATRFENDAWEGRVELVYETDTWNGVIGVQHADKAFSAIGEEAFIPPVDTIDSGIFWVVERPYDSFDLETGIRVGRVDHDPDSGASENFATYAASIGVVVPVNDQIRIGAVADYSTRAPVAEELYSNGPHLVTGTFELGNPKLDNERAANLSATVEIEKAGWSATVTGYYTRFSDFIYQRTTGEELLELPVVAYRQDDATYVGLDVELNVRIVAWSEGELEVKAMFDFVNARLDATSSDHLPRIPPARYGIGLDARWQRVTASIDYLRVGKQNDVDDLELVSDAYNDLSAYVGVEVPLSDALTLDLFAHGKNLTDDDQRIHTSFIKEFAPAPGRTIEVGARLNF